MHKPSERLLVYELRAKTAVPSSTYPALNEGYDLGPPQTIIHDSEEDHEFDFETHDVTYIGSIPRESKIC